MSERHQKTIKRRFWSASFYLFCAILIGLRYGSENWVYAVMSAGMAVLAVQLIISAALSEYIENPRRFEQPRERPTFNRLDYLEDDLRSIQQELDQASDEDRAKLEDQRRATLTLIKRLKNPK